MNLIRRYKTPLIIIALCVPSIWHLLYSGYFSVHDDMHPAWVLEMYRAIQSGQIPPRWAPDLSYGYGYPLFHFIYPLPYYLGALFYILGINLIWSVKLTYVVSVIGSAFAMLAFAKQHLNIRSALFATLVYIYTPYRAVNIYVRGAYGESLAWIFIPLIFLSIDNISRKSSPKKIALMGLSICGLLLTHNIAAFATLPFAFAYGLWRLFRADNRVKTFIHLLIAAVAGISASAYFWLPALIDKNLMITNTIFNFKDHFPFLKQLIWSPWGYGASLWGPDDGFSFQIGIFNLLAIITCGIIVTYRLIKAKKNIGLAVFLLLSCGFSIYMMNIRSSWIWDNFPLLDYFQFPWRWLILTTFFSSILAGIFFSYLDSLNKKTQTKILFILAVVIFSINIRYFQPDKHISVTPDTITNKYFAINPLDSFSEESKLYKTIQEEYLRLPVQTNIRPSSYPYDRVTSSNPNTQIIWKQINPTFYQITTQGEASDLSIQVYEFPLWQVLLDGQSYGKTFGQPYGQMVISVPSGSHQLKVYIRESGWRIWISILSGITLGLLVIISLYPKLKND